MAESRGHVADISGGGMGIGLLVGTGDLKFDEVAATDQTVGLAIGMRQILDARNAAHEHWCG
jgi:hypothetical protein